MQNLLLHFLRYWSIFLKKNQIDFINIKMKTMQFVDATELTHWKQCKVSILEKISVSQ